jgi:uncharacterized protein (TIGR00369 family)
MQTDFPELREGGNDVVLETVIYGACRTRLVHHKRHLRPGGTISGPSMFMLADLSLYIAVMSVVGMVPLAVTTGMTINFLNRPSARDLIGECRLLKIGKRLCIGEISLFSEGGSDLIAHATGTYSIPPLS